jgi:hypothetical protein
LRSVSTPPQRILSFNPDHSCLKRVFFHFVSATRARWGKKNAA